MSRPTTPAPAPVPPPRFLHVPRTGGTALQYEWELEPPEYRGHEPAYAGEGLRYTFVRYPYERLVSAFFFRRSTYGSTPADFHRFVEEELPAASAAGGAGGGGAGGWPSVVFWPQVRWAGDADLIYRYEERQLGLERLAAILGRGAPRPWVGLEDGDVWEGPLTRWYTPRIAYIVLEIYAQDFALGGYSPYPEDLLL